MKTKIALQTSEEPGEVALNETLFRTLVQQSADVLLLTNQHCIISFANNALTAILGYYPDEMNGRSVFEIIHPDDKELMAAWLAQIIEKPDYVRAIELRARHAVGNWVYLEAVAQNLLADEDVASLAFYLRDIQAKKMADQALMQAEQRLTLLLNNTRESFIILDKQLNVTAYNRAAQEHSPYFFRSELRSGLSLMELIYPDDTAEYSFILQQVLAGKEMETQSSYRAEDGSLHIYQHNFRAMGLGNEQSIFITSSDITQRRLAEVALQESQEKFRTIIEYSFDAVLIIDEQATITYVSPSITHLLGFEPDELVATNGFDFIHADDLAVVQQKFQSILDSVDETFADYRCRTKSGDYKWLEAKGKNMLTNKYVNGILVSLRDISERKRMLTEQSELVDQLSKYNKDLQQFSFITSHNLRAPVANLISLLSLYDKSKPADPLNQQLMEKFHQCTDTLNETLNDLINVLVIRSKPNSAAEYLLFEDVLQQCVQQVQVLLTETGGRIDHDFSAVAGVEYNKLHLESIFLNLITNSIKYASSERELLIRVCSGADAKGTCLIFEDNGVGIDLSRYGDRIFGLYQRFHAAKDGKGLGLYMIKSQITASGGSIAVESQPNKGARFIIHFPAG